MCGCVTQGLHHLSLPQELIHEDHPQRQGKLQLPNRDTHTDVSVEGRSVVQTKTCLGD